MITLASLFGVFTVALIMVLTPGPNMMYLVSGTMTQGRRAGVISLGRVALRYLVCVTATNLGLRSFHCDPRALCRRKTGRRWLSGLAGFYRTASPRGLTLRSGRTAHGLDKETFMMGCSPIS